MNYGNTGYRTRRGNGPALLSSISTNIRPLRGNMFNKPGVEYTQDFFTYVVNFGNVASGATANQQSFTVQADSHFEWVMSTWYGYINAYDGTAVPLTDAQIVPLFVFISDGGAGRQLMSAPVCMSSIAGIGRDPFYLPVPRIFMSKSQVTFNLNNADPDNQWNNIQLNLIGRKIFESGAGQFPY